MLAIWQYHFWPHLNDQKKSCVNSCRQKIGPIYHQCWSFFLAQSVFRYVSFLCCKMTLFVSNSSLRTSTVDDWAGHLDAVRTPRKKCTILMSAVQHRHAFQIFTLHGETNDAIKLRDLFLFGIDLVCTRVKSSAAMVVPILHWRNIESNIFLKCCWKIASNENEYLIEFEWFQF